MEHTDVQSPLQRRGAGILLHPTSLPGHWDCGDLGEHAYRFVDFLAAAGQRVWQILPLGPTHEDGSPYQCFSVHAGNPLLISVEQLVGEGWLADPPAPEGGAGARLQAIDAAAAGFRERADNAARAALARFEEENAHWLPDFARYVVLKQLHQGRSWVDWAPDYRDRDAGALAQLDQEHADRLAQVRFEQFAFFRQWGRLKQYANERDIAIFGDMPIFVAHDSADVWAQRACFLLDETGVPTVVAGVPPDYFSATGQRWGNPHYDWEWMEADGFRWWHRRMESQLRLFDLVRVDHFRGFESYWEIPAHEETAINGRWVKAPGDALFASLCEHFNPLPVVAEDLGTITDAVYALRDRYALPGMKVLHFAFGGGPENPYLPHNHEANGVVYTGTHDNNTTLGWYGELDEAERGYIHEYLSRPEEPMPWPLIRTALASVARLAVVPMQDVLELDGEHRMNQPGTSAGNWSWRFAWEQVPEGLAEHLRHLAGIYGRLL